MWTCENCGCMGIAASLASCPQCHHERAAPWRAEGEPGAVPAVTDLKLPEPPPEPASGDPGEAQPW